MTVAEMFSKFLGNLAIANGETISTRYGELTAALNKKFRDTESKEANTLQVGSFGRRTGINGISDLDMLYIMPKTKWVDYNKDAVQLKLYFELGMMCAVPIALLASAFLIATVIPGATCVAIVIGLSAGPAFWRLWRSARHTHQVLCETRHFIFGKPAEGTGDQGATAR